MSYNASRPIRLDPDQILDGSEESETIVDEISDPGIDDKMANPPNTTVTTTFLTSGDVAFETLIAQTPPLPLAAHIPKVAHFVHSKVVELTWLEYATTRNAFTQLGVTKVKIWIPASTGKLPGKIWARLREMEGVEIVRIVMPHTAWGKKFPRIEHQSDLARIKILYVEGGIYMDTDMLALKSADELIYDNKTKATVLAKQNPRYDHSISNARIMSKAGSPFLQRWMEKYRDFDPGEWDHTSCQVPLDMAEKGDPDLTVLDYRKGWMYPMLNDGREVGPDPHLATMWLGKGWWDINESYGVHMWKWDGGHLARPVPMSPEIVRGVDTPLFCRMRSGFDDIDGDGYVSVPWEADPNCSVSWVADLKDEEYKLFGDWTMQEDEMDFKWLDSSGHRNHGFGAAGTNLTHDKDSGVRTRRFEEGSRAWLPVPADWDARVGTARVSFTVDEDAWFEREEGIGLFKIRMDYAGEIVLTLRRDDLFDAPLLNFEWIGSYLAEDQYKGLDDLSWTSTKGLNLSSTSPNDLAVSFDRKKTGSIAVYFNGQEIAHEPLDLISGPKIGNEIWFNAKEFKDLDTGFRGDLYRFTMYADVVPGTIYDDTAVPHKFIDWTHMPIHHTRSTTISFMLCIPLLCLLLTGWIWRARIMKRMRTFDSSNTVHAWHARLQSLIRAPALTGYAQLESQDAHEEAKRP